MSNSFTAGLVQMSSTDNVAHNIRSASALIREAAKKGAEFILTPEMTNLLEVRRDILFANILTEDQDPALAALRALAAELNIWLLAGSLAIRLSDHKAANRCYLISADGNIAARYDKIHMFDVDLPGGESYRESGSYRPGDQAVLARTPWGKVGLSVCYDLRFPGLYRELALGGATILSVPAAFTKVTGEVHWHTLLKARAIENGAFVLAPAQTGRHSGGRETFGHSLAVGPWGDILADGGKEAGVTLAKLCLSDVDEARARIPSLQHGRDVKVTSV